MRLNVGMLCLMATLAVTATVEAQPGGGGGRGGRGGGMFGRGGNIISVAANEAVTKELALTEEVAAKVKTVSDDYGTAMREAMQAGGTPDWQNMSEEERTKMMEKMAETRKTTLEKFIPKLKEVITADQFTRVQQIYWQSLGTAALSEAEIVKALPLSKDQQDKIKTVSTEYGAKTRELFQGGGGGGRGGNPEAFTKIQELNKERDSKITEVLTKEQQDKFASLKGKEFDVTQLGGGRGPGGGGGGRGAGGGGVGKRPQPKAE